MSGPIFRLGQVVATLGALEASCTSQLLGYLARHVRCDWGCVDAEDAQANDIAISAGDRLLSAYPIDPQQPCAGYGKNCLWIITEADRSATTILLPDEY